MTVTGDQHLVKQINKSLVLETIRWHSPISRAQVSQVTGLNKGTVSSLVNELIQSDLVRETGPGQSSGGRKPLMLLFHHLAGYAIGVDLRVDSISAVLTDLQGNIIERTEQPLQTNDVEKVCSILKDAIHSLIAKAPESAYGVVGIGVGVPGIVDENGTILFAPNLKWQNVPLQHVLAAEFQLPVVIDNEARTGAQGEKQFGAGQESSNLVYISVGHGIGTGVVMNKELYKGSRGFSGEAGHFSIETNGELCSCGNRGCWELYASEKALFRQAARLTEVQQQLRQTGKDSPDMELLVSLAANGNAAVIGLFQQIGMYLGIGITNLINIFNPESIILGNRMTIAQPWIQETLFHTVAERALPYHQQQLQILFSQLGMDSTVVGAASFAISQFFTRTKVLVD
ncbi:ROK family transcriptional regulator [Brevibacillus migulae]|uniref:ROK family transcriptional regulator n=1 Tax=Brevibacillus migulae TaxID=1644114 RepID=UPI00196AFF41|nr:ROK family transcriptional regulator [Brevibacillus migulae]